MPFRLRGQVPMWKGKQETNVLTGIRLPARLKRIIPEE